MSELKFNLEDKQNALLRLQQDLALREKAVVPRKDLTIGVETTVLKSQEVSTTKVASASGGQPPSGKANFWVGINGALAKYEFVANLVETA